MEYLIEITLGLFTAIVTLGIIAKKLTIPYPIALVIGGLLISFIPGLPQLELDPELIFFTILPPILFSGGYFTPVGTFKKNIAPITHLALGLVILTTITVGLFAHYYYSIPWAAAFILGAIISPPDAIAATAITSRLKVNQQVISIIEGESLVNDASALVIYRLAIGALVTGTFSLMSSSVDFIAVCLGGITIGLILAWTTIKLFCFISEASLTITVSLMLPYLCYIIADSLKMSGVLASVTAGIFIGWHLPTILNPLVRLEMSSVWKMFVFLLNGAAFILIGLQLPIIVKSISHLKLVELIIFALILNLVLIAVRFLWVFLSIYLPAKLFASVRKKHPHIDWKNSFIISWCSMRGVVSLAAALALPLYINQELFLERNLIVFLTFSVIFVTLILQGLSLPFLIKKLSAQKGLDESEEVIIRIKTSQAALDKIEEIAMQKNIDSITLEKIRSKYAEKIEKASFYKENKSDENSFTSKQLYRQVQIDLLNFEQQKVAQLRNKGLISNEIARRLLIELDFEAARLHNTHIID